MDKLLTAEFKEAFDEFDTVINIEKFGNIHIACAGREWHNLPGGAAGRDEGHGAEPYRG